MPAGATQLEGTAVQNTASSLIEAINDYVGLKNSGVSNTALARMLNITVDHARGFFPFKESLTWENQSQTCEYLYTVRQSVDHAVCHNTQFRFPIAAMADIQSMILFYEGVHAAVECKATAAAEARAKTKNAKRENKGSKSTEALPKSTIIIGDTDEESDAKSVSENLRATSPRLTRWMWTRSLPRGRRISRWLWCSSQPPPLQEGSFFQGQGRSRGGLGAGSAQDAC
ncbi:hypothetical protein B0H19DRAFT_1386569, partial [Mycena capillaripes]